MPLATRSRSPTSVWCLKLKMRAASTWRSTAFPKLLRSMPPARNSPHLKGQARKSAGRRMTLWIHTLDTIPALAASRRVALCMGWNVIAKAWRTNAWRTNAWRTNAWCTRTWRSKAWHAKWFVLPVLVLWTVPAAAQSVAAIPPPRCASTPSGATAVGRNPVCLRLEASSPRSTAADADPAKAEQIRRNEEAAAKQQAELDRLGSSRSGWAARERVSLPCSADNRRNAVR